MRFPYRPALSTCLSPLEPGDQPDHLTLDPALPLALRDRPRAFPASSYLSPLSLFLPSRLKSFYRPFMHINAFVTFKVPYYVRTITLTPTRSYLQSTLMYKIATC